MLNTKVLVADCIVAVFDASRPETFSSEMVPLLQQVNSLLKSSPPIPVLIVGIKMDIVSLVSDDDEAGIVSQSFMAEIQAALDFPFICGCFLPPRHIRHPSCTPVSTIFQLAMFYATTAPQMLYDRASSLPTATTSEAALYVYWQLDNKKRHELDDSTMEQVEKICFSNQGNGTFLRKQLWLLRSQERKGVTAADFFCC